MARILHQRTYHKPITTAKPHAQSVISAAIQTLTAACELVIGAEISVTAPVNGWLACVTAADHCACTAARALGQCIRLPTAMNNANGTRNFSDAASQSAYLTRACAGRNKRTIPPATAANTVDCHR
jgi:hypothetical protein